MINAFKEAQVDLGDRVTVTLSDLVDTDKGNPFKAYTVTKVEVKDSAGLFDN
jgi:hypothetical protein